LQPQVAAILVAVVLGGELCMRCSLLASTSAGLRMRCAPFTAFQFSFNSSRC
jgi:hypothetical protein